MGSISLQEFINLALSAAGVVTAIWALFTWRVQQRYNSTRWQNELVNKFYFSEEFHNIRLRFEFDFHHYYAPSLEKWDTNKNLLSDDDKNRIGEVDSVVNFFENLLYIIAQGHISEKDHFAAFSYWYVLMRDEEHACLRQYLRYGFENIQKRTKMVCPTYFWNAEGVIVDDIEILLNEKHLIPKGKAKLKAILQDGLINKGDKELGGQLYEVSDVRVFDRLDAALGFDPANWPDSRAVRRYVRLQEPELGAWIYIHPEQALFFSQRRTGQWQLQDPK